mgnify:FL=1
MGKRLLIADDEAGILELLKRYFEMAGYEVYTARDGGEVLEKAAYRPDLILLDINMPGTDGLEICRLIRDHVSCPILFLTARIEISDKLAGFTAGGDDYIVKPFDLDELGARVAAHLRREGRRREEGTLRRFFGEMSIDYGRREITVRGTPVALSKTEFDIVELLSVHTGQIFDREHIYEAVWGLEGEGSSDTVMEHVRKIRAKLAAVTDDNYIETVWGVGYKWSG